MNTIQNGYEWFGDEIIGQYTLRKITDTSSTVICVFRPKPTYEYLEYLGIVFFKDKNLFLEWYNTPNWWYAETAPCDVTMKEAIDRMIRMVIGLYI